MLFLGALLGCAGSRAEEMASARVVILNTDPPQPIAGAKVVLTYWHTTAQLLGHPTRGCNRAWLAQTDEGGWFRYPRAPGDDEVFTHAYQRGYRQPKYGEGAISSTGTRFLLPIASSETNADRIRELNAYLIGILECRRERDKPAIEDFRNALLPELRELYEQARKSGNVDDADAALGAIESITLDSETAFANSSARAVAHGRLLGGPPPKITIQAAIVPSSEDAIPGGRTTVIKTDRPSPAQIAAAPSAVNVSPARTPPAVPTRMRIEELSPDSARTLRAGERVRMRLVTSYNLQADSGTVSLSISGPGGSRLVDDAVAIKRGAGKITFNAEFVAPGAGVVYLMTELTVPEQALYVAVDRREFRVD